MEFSTPVTKDLATKVMKSIVNIMVDKEYGPKRKNKKYDPGDFKMIYKGKTHNYTNQAFGLDLTVNGN